MSRSQRDKVLREIPNSAANWVEGTHAGQANFVEASAAARAASAFPLLGAGSILRTSVRLMSDELCSPKNLGVKPYFRRLLQRLLQRLFAGASAVLEGARYL